LRREIKKEEEKIGEPGMAHQKPKQAGKK